MAVKDGAMRADGKETQRRVLEFVVAYKTAHDGVSPTVREIGHELAMVHSAVFYHLRKLEERGLVRFIGIEKSRGIMVTGGRWVGPSTDFGNGLNG